MKKILAAIILLLIMFTQTLRSEEEKLPVIDLRAVVSKGGPGRDLATYDLICTEGDKAIPFLIPYLENDAYPGVRAVIAEGLGHYGDASIAIPALLKAREDKDWVVRMRVARALLQRGKEKEAVPVLLSLISEKRVYYELIMDLYKINSKEAKEEIKKGVTIIRNDKISSPVIKAYCIVILAYIYNEQFTISDKELIIQAIKESDNSTDRRDGSVIYRIVQNIGPNKNNPSITKEDYIAILKTAQLSTHENIAEEASRLLNWFEKEK